MSRRPPAGRLRALLALLIMSLIAVGARISVLQFRDADLFVALAKDQWVREIDLPARRGSIFDRTGNELAISSAAKAVWADPSRVQGPRRTAAKLAGVLEMRRRPVLEALRKEGSFVYLARRLDVSVADRVERLDLPGIGLLDETKRYYPAGDLVPQVLGFVGVDGAGLAGIELEHDDLLAGTPGKLIAEQDPAGRSIPQGVQRRVEPVAGGDLVLTIDRDLAFQAQRALRDAVRANGAKGGTVLILDPSNGDVLAMATYPWFDANAFTEARPAVIRNRAVTDVYEPGSVNKIITAAAALEEGVVSMRERMEVPDSVQVGDKLFRDVHPHPPMAMTISDVIAK
jgi:cell division protein FtsI/penicillin-binding protein 2